jgi:hypothetical protein
MSTYIGKRVLLRDAASEWWDALCNDLREEVGIMHYELLLDNGDTLLIPVEDVSAILEKRKPLKKKGNVIKFPRKKIKRRA